MLECDFVSGWSENIGDGSPIWAHADRAETVAGRENVHRHTCGENLTARLQRLKIDQDQAEGYGEVRPRSLWVVYSYGAARFFKCLLAMPAAERPQIDCLIIIVGVNRLADGQSWDACWNVPDCVLQAYCFVTPIRGNAGGYLVVIPECCPIRDAGAETLRFRQEDKAWQMQGADGKRMNIECFWQGVDHGSVVSLPIVAEVIDRAVARWEAA